MTPVTSSAELTASELVELTELYVSFYETDCWGLRDLARMYALEAKASEAQLAKLLAKYGRTLDDTFA